MLIFEQIQVCQNLKRIISAHMSINVIPIDTYPLASNVKVKLRLLNYAILGYHSNELSNTDTLHGLSYPMDHERTNSHLF
jgi:hypothetical protein